MNWPPAARANAASRPRLLQNLRAIAAEKLRIAGGIDSKEKARETRARKPLGDRAARRAGARR
jgi:hypothetical protein